MEQIVKYIFIIEMCLSPLGCAVAVMYMRAARKALNEQKLGRALYYKTLAPVRFIVAIMDLAIGSLGYFLVTRRIFPSIDSTWLLLLVAPSGLVLMLFTRRASNIRRQYEEPRA